MEENNDIEQNFNKIKERKTLIVIICTIIAMFIEIYCGYRTKSMSLLAEGYHMITHVITFSLAYIAYVLARKLKDSPHFKNGTEKIGVLAAYTSSVFLGITGIWIVVESLLRFSHPEEIMFNEALFIAVFGFVVNFICILVMEGKGHFHYHEHKHEDYNFKAAYYHILADVMTSFLAIIALLIGKVYDCIHLDAFIGIVCGLLILKWAATIIKHTVKILIDIE